MEPRKTTNKDNTYISSIKSLINKKVKVGFDESTIEGKFVGANFNPLNVVLDINGKLMIIKGPNYVREL